MNFQRKSLRFVCGGLLVWMATMSSGPNHAQSKGEYEHRGFTSHQSRDRREISSTYREIEGFAFRPETDGTYRAVFQAPKLDMFGNRCEVKGQLNFRPNDGSDVGAPVNWFQGIYVYLATNPETVFDWSSGMDQNLALGVTKILENDGTFTVEFDLRKTKRDPSLAQGLQIGISLANHKELNGQGTSQTVTWTTIDPAIPNTVQMIKIPASQEIAPELRLIDQASSWPFSDPDGRKLIRAVNALHSLGKENALATLQTYTENIGDVFNDGDIVFWVIRLLFEPVDPQQRIDPPGIAVYLGLGEDEDEKKENSKLWPLNPMESVNDVPFMIGHQIGMGGRPEHPASDIQWAQESGVMRMKPLTPSVSPIHAAQTLLMSQKFKSLPDYDRNSAKQFIRKQAFAMSELSTKNDTRNSEITDQQWDRQVALDYESERGWRDRE